jgi:hypothetical protein
MRSCRLQPLTTKRYSIRESIKVDSRDLPSNNRGKYYELNVNIIGSEVNNVTKM